MIGLLLDPTTSESPPKGLLQGQVAGVLVARLKRFLNGWVAAAIAYRERQATLLALSQRDDRKLDETRVYRGPIDDALEKAARLRERLLKHS